MCGAAVNTLLSRMCALAYASIKETDGGENKKPGGKKFVPSNILVIHSQNVIRSDALAPKSEIFPTKSNIYLHGTHSGSIHPCCSEVITCRRQRAAAWCMVWFLAAPPPPLSLWYSRSEDMEVLIWSVCSRARLVSFTPAIPPGARWPLPGWRVSEELWEKFSMPLRDNYQTVELPHISGWVITSLHLSFFSPTDETVAFRGPDNWQFPGALACPEDSWMKRAREKHCGDSSRSLHSYGFFMSPGPIACWVIWYSRGELWRNPANDI